MEEKTNIIYVGEKDGITEIIDKIKAIPAKIITLVVPEDAMIFQDVTNLKILQKKSEEMGKEISISKSEFSDMFVKREAPVAVPAVAAPSHSSLKSMDGMKKSPGISSRVRRISDMVEKNETVDLRQISRKKSAEKERRQYAEPAEPENVYRMQEPIQSMQELKSEEIKKENAVYPSINIAEEREEKPLPKVDYRVQEDNKPKPEEISWEDLGKNTAQKTEQEKKVDKLFDGGSRLNPKNENTKKFDFSYPYAGSKKKNKKSLSLIPTISARFFAIFILICILTASLSLFFILPKADVAIALKKETAKGDYTFVLDQAISAIDADSGKIPAQKTEVSSSQTQSFTATGKKHVTSPATGEITIMNECSTGPQSLVAGTRFLSKDGAKIYKISENVTIPGFTKPESDVVPGQKTVQVTSEGTGESYNIQATSFTIPKLQEQASWKYACLYARSTKPMTGGADKDVTFISQDDLDKAKVALTELVKQKNATQISQQESADAIFIDDQGTEGDVVPSTTAKVNDVADKFDMTVTIKKSILFVQKADLESLIEKRIITQNNFQNAKPVQGSIQYEIGDTDNKDSQFSLDVTAQEDFTFDLNQEQIKNDIMGKNQQQLNDYFTNISGIKSASIKLWPFWVKSVPNSVNKINISVTN